MPIIIENAVVVSGINSPLLNAIEWPSGQFGSNEPGSQLCAFLSSINATFGFNINPHNIQTEWIPCGGRENETCDFHGASGQLPDIGHFIELYVGDFYFKGKVVHSDYTSSTNGTVVSVHVEDDRKSLRKTKLHTEDLGEDAPSGVVSIARAYRIINGLNNVDGTASDPLIQEYRRILQFGGTYSQILQALDLEYSNNKSAIPIAILPTVEQLEKNLGGAIGSLRFQFNLSPLDQALTRILFDTGYDWYWNMNAQQVNLINKKVEFNLQESDLIDLVSEFGSLSGLDSTKQLSFGQDVVPDPTRFRVLGGHQEGFINSELLSVIDGVDTSALDGHIVFFPAWDRLTVGFFDADGFYRTYVPTERELQLALAGIEQWSYFKKYQTADPEDDPPGFGFPSDAGSIAAQHTTFQSRLDPLMPLAAFATGLSESGIRIISNRRDSEHNWTIAFYNRLVDHASRHYGRSYVAEGLLYNEASGLFRLIDAAWANVENQVEGYPLSASGVVIFGGGSGVYIEDYEINRRLGPVSPFVTDDFRIRAYCRLPSGTVYGPQGDDSPASFGNWTEDAPPFNPNGDGGHYIPVNLASVGQRVIDPRSDELYSFEAFPEGTVYCQLPINAGPSSGLLEDNILRTLATLITTFDKVHGSGQIDIINPSIVLNAYPELSGVAIPIEARSRYGQTYPSQWVLGNQHYERDEDVQLDDQFVPWAFSPEGNQTSLQVMTDGAIRRVEGKIVSSSTSRYADFQQVGLPLLSFDAFAEQGIGEGGLYGEISHGVNELNITFGIEGFSTHYKIQSYFPQFGKDAPLGERVRAILNGILNPIDFASLKLLNQDPGDPTDPLLPDNPLPPPIFFDNEQRAVRVTITEVNNVFTIDSTPGTEEPERYRGVDRHLYLKPPPAGGSSDQDLNEGAICIDGFLNLDDEALYNTDEFEIDGGNIVTRYFTSGRPYGNSTIVEVVRTNINDSSKYDVVIVDPTAEVQGIERAILGVEVLNGSVNIGERTTLAVQGDAPVSPGASNGTIFINGTTQATAGITPVEIISMVNQGSDTALAVCKELGLGVDNKYSIASGQMFTNVVPIPFRQFAASGDRGFLTTPIAVPSGGFGKTSPVSFIEIVRPAFRNF